MTLSRRSAAAPPVLADIGAPRTRSARTLGAFVRSRSRPPGGGASGVETPARGVRYGVRALCGPSPSRRKPSDLLGFVDAGGGTRTPDTRIMMASFEAGLALERGSGLRYSGCLRLVLQSREQGSAHSPHRLGPSRKPAVIVGDGVSRTTTGCSTSRRSLVRAQYGPPHESLQIAGPSSFMAGVVDPSGTLGTLLGNCRSTETSS